MCILGQKTVQNVKSVAMPLKMLYNRNKEVKCMKTDVLSKVVKAINFSVKVDSNSTNTTAAFQPKLPKQYNQFKKNDR